MVACLVDARPRQGHPGTHGARQGGRRRRRRGRRRQRGVRRALLPAGAHGQRPLRRQVPAVDGHRPAADRQEARRDGAQATAPRRSPTAAPARATTRCASTSACAPSTRTSRSSRRRAAPTGTSREELLDYVRRARHPGAAHQEEPLLDRREPLGAQQRVRRARRPVGGAARGRLPVRRVGRRRARRAAARRGRASRRACRWRSTATRWAWSS